MAARTTETTVTFRHPFTLTALGRLHPAGTYAIETDEEEVPGLSFSAFQRTATLLRLPANSTSGGRSEVVPIDPVELAAALKADAALPAPLKDSP